MEGSQRKHPYHIYYNHRNAFMFLPPFGMLLGKWMALEAVYAVPLAAILFVLASAATMVLGKMACRLLQVTPKLGKDRVSVSQL